jgi:hypothetical protein
MQSHAHPAEEGFGSLGESLTEAFKRPYSASMAFGNCPGWGLFPVGENAANKKCDSKPVQRC